MLVKDEADVIGYTIAHLLTQVDAIIVADNGSTDGTREILARYADDGMIEVHDDTDVGHWQSRKTTWLAQRALELGHEWVLPCDADEWWTAEDRTIRDYLDGITPDVRVIQGRLMHYFPTQLDDSDERDPYRRITWRLKEQASLPKVCCRTNPRLVIHDGNHGADYGDRVRALTVWGLRVDHFSWRSADQYVRKITNGSRAFAATDLNESIGAHWRMHGDPDAVDFEDRVRRHFYRFFFSRDPKGDGYVRDPVIDKRMPDGWLTEEEAQALASLTAGKRVLELGSYMGRSTVAIARVASLVVSVDRHQGYEQYGVADSLAGWREATRDFRNVIGMVCDFEQALLLLGGHQFDAVFLDGSHDAASVAGDLAAAISLAPTVILHDYGYYGVAEGVARLGLTARPVGGSIAVVEGV